MPRKGYSSLTLPDDLRDDLDTEAEHHGWSVTQLLKNLLDMKRGLRVPVHHNTHEDAQGIVYDLCFYVEVSRRTYRTLRYGSRVYNKPMGDVMQKFIDQF